LQLDHTVTGKLVIVSLKKEIAHGGKLSKQIFHLTFFISTSLSWGCGIVTLNWVIIYDSSTGF
jgi:hypothetical protein